tara:strand:- start:1094 stop:2071 length:978 start_codon:yes stop_codon:yes gene_type:complete
MIKKYEVLVGTGCSHTQGCAIIDFNKDDVLDLQKLPLATKELKKHYGKEYVNTEWITENYSWIGKLNNDLKCEKIINFGLGGAGIDQCVRSIFNYGLDVPNFDNHLFIMQLPDPNRLEIIWNIGLNSGGSWRHLQRNKSRNRTERRHFDFTREFFRKGERNETYKKMVMNYYDNFYDEEMNWCMGIEKILRLQQYIESNKGEFFVFIEPFLNLLFTTKHIKGDDLGSQRTLLEDMEEIWETVLCNNGYYIRSYHRDLTIKTFKQVWDRINLMDLTDLENYHTTDPHYRRLLRGVGLMKDGHFSDEGNEWIGKLIYNWLTKNEDNT